MPYPSDGDDEVLRFAVQRAPYPQHVAEVAVGALVEAPGEADAGLDREDISLPTDLPVRAGHLTTTRRPAR